MLQYQERVDSCVSREALDTHIQVDSDDEENTLQATRTAEYLRVSAPTILAHSLIASALPRFREQHANVRVHLVITDDAREAERYDAAIQMGPLDAQRDACSRPLAVIPEVLCASPAFLDAHGLPLDPWELKVQHCIGIFAEGQRPRAWSFRQGETEVKVVPASPLAFSEPRSAVATAVRGGGIVLAPALAVEAEIAAGLLTPLLADWRTPQHAVWLERRKPSAPGIDAFAEFVAGLLPA